MARATSASAWTALLALTVGCSSSSTDSAASSGDTGSGNGGAGTGGAGSTGKGSGTAVASSSVVGSTAAAGGAGGRPFVCDPPAEPGSIYEATADSFAFVEPVSMCKYRGDVMLVVNTAAL